MTHEQNQALSVANVNAHLKELEAKKTKWAKEILATIKIIKRYKNSNLTIGEICEKEKISIYLWNRAYRWHLQINRK